MFSEKAICWDCISRLFSGSVDLYYDSFTKVAVIEEVIEKKPDPYQLCLGV